MNFTIATAIEILEQTPGTLTHMLQNLSAAWTTNNEGGDTWSVYNVIGHLAHGERTDWMTRAELILSDNTDKTFKTFDRLAQFKASEGKSLQQLLEEFAALRNRNIETLRSKKITEQDLLKKGIHPVFGEVTLSQLLSTWTVHDLDHISQISRVMAKQYKEAVGPWIEYLKILQQ